MNRLSPKERAQTLHLLCEGKSILAVTRLTGVSKNTVTKLLIDAGKSCMPYHDQFVRRVKSNRIQADEIWTFTCAKQKNVTDDAPDGAGDYMDLDGHRCRHETDRFLSRPRESRH